MSGDGKARNRRRPPEQKPMAPFVLLTDRPASIQVYDHLRDEIIKGSIKPGTNLSEVGLCGHFEVSRQPVREALLRLSTDNLVRIYPQRGSEVTRISSAMVRRAQVIREAVEVEMLRRAMEKPVDRLLADLGTEIKIQRTFAEVGDADRFFVSDQNFHRLICEQGGGPGVWESLEASRTQLDRARFADLQLAEAFGLLIRQHEKIRAGIKAKNTKRATDAMRIHLRRVLDSLRRSKKSAPELYDDGTGNGGGYG